MHFKTKLKGKTQSFSTEAEWKELINTESYNTAKDRFEHNDK